VRESRNSELHQFHLDSSQIVSININPEVNFKTEPAKPHMGNSKRSRDSTFDSMPASNLTSTRLVAKLHHIPQSKGTLTELVAQTRQQALTAIPVLTGREKASRSALSHHK